MFLVLKTALFRLVGAQSIGNAMKLLQVGLFICHIRSERGES